MVVSLDYKSFKFPVSKIRLNRKLMSTLMCLDIKINICIQFIYQKKNLKIIWSYC